MGATSFSEAAATSTARAATNKTLMTVNVGMAVNYAQTHVPDCASRFLCHRGGAPLVALRMRVSLTGFVESQHLRGSTDTGSSESVASMQTAGDSGIEGEEPSAPLNSTAAVTLLGLLRSEARFVSLLSMIQALFLEPVMPVERSPLYEQVFATLEPVCNLHTLSWNILEPLLDDSGASSCTEAALESFALAFVAFVDLWAVYIPFIVNHERSQLALKQLIQSDPKVGPSLS